MTAFSSGKLGIKPIRTSSKFLQVPHPGCFPLRRRTRVCARFDDVFVAPVALDDIDRQMAAMRRQMDQQFDSMDRAFDRAFARADQDLADMDRALTRLNTGLTQSGADRAVQRLDDGGPTWSRSLRTETSQRSFSTYSHISVEVRSSSSAWAPPIAVHQHTSVNLVPPLALLAALVASAYAAAATAFFKNFDLSLYKQERRWHLTLLWPLMYVFSDSFRRQFAAVVRGTRPRVVDISQEPGGNPDDASKATSAQS